MELLESKNVTKTFGGLAAVRDLSFQVKSGQIVGLVGPNGSGKSTWINLATGFMKPTSGEILVKGHHVENLRPHEAARLGLVRTFQLTSTFARLTARENIIAASYLNAQHSLGGSFARSVIMSRGYRSEERRLRERADEVLALLEMEGKGHIVADQLLSVEQRKLEIAIALACEPDLLMLDEPAAGMSPEETSRVMVEIQALRTRGITILLVEHNMRVISGICDHVVVINYGTRIAEGPPAVVLNDELVISTYLGDQLL